MKTDLRLRLKGSSDFALISLLLVLWIAKPQSPILRETIKDDDLSLDGAPLALLPQNEERGPFVGSAMLLAILFSDFLQSLISFEHFSVKPEIAVSNPTNDPKALCPTKCSKILGQNGTWIQDWNYSAMHGQYPSRAVPNKPYGARTYGRFQPSDDAPFPWPTSFRWVDSNSLMVRAVRLTTQ